MLSTAWIAPGLVGPALAGMVADHVGWRWVFLALAPMMVAGGALAVPALRSLGPPPGADAPPAGRTGAAVRLAIAAALALAAGSLDSVLQGAILFAGAAALGIPSLGRLVPEGTLTARPRLPAAVAVMALLSAGFFGAEVFVPLALTDVRGQPAALAGIAFTATTLTWTVGAWLQERLAPRHSRRVMVDAGLAVMIVGILGTAAVLLPEVHPWVAAATWGVTGLGMGVAYSTTALVVLESAPEGKEGEASAAMQLANVLGTAIGTGVSGAVLARFHAAGSSAAVAIGVADAIAVGVILVGIAAGMRLPGRPRP
jgi:MFS family permease